MNISKNGLDLIKRYEGCILSAYDDMNNSVVTPGESIGGTLTIGWGHTSAAGEPKVFVGQKITQQEADDILVKDLAKVEKDVNRLVKVPLNQNQFDALVSFHYNTGSLGKSSALKSLNNGDYEDAATRLGLYIKGRRSDGSLVVMKGLQRRRADEIKLFNKPVIQQTSEVKMSLNFPFNIIASIFGPDKVGGWVRAAVATGLGFLAAKLSGVPFFSELLSPEVIASISAAASAIVVGLWSQVTKSEAQAGNIPSSTVAISDKVLDHSRKD